MRNISPQELLRLVNEGADVKMPEMPATQLAGLGAITEYIQAMAENQVRMVESIDRLTKVLSDKSVDLGPLVDAMGKHESDDQQENYDFEIQRLPNGRISGLTTTITKQ